MTWSTWFSCEQWLLPIFQKKHWFVVQVDFKLKQIVAYDSLSMDSRKEGCAAALRAVHRFVADLHVEREKKAFDFTGWSQAHLQVCDQRPEDWFNCGVYAFVTIWCLARRAPVSLMRLG